MGVSPFFIFPINFSWLKIREVLEDQTVMKDRLTDDKFGVWIKAQKNITNHAWNTLRASKKRITSVRKGTIKTSECVQITHSNQSQRMETTDLWRPGGKRREGTESYHPSRSIFKFQVQWLRQRYRPCDSEWQGWASGLSGTAERCHSSLGRRVICVSNFWHFIVLIKHTGGKEEL